MLRVMLHFLGVLISKRSNCWGLKKIEIHFLGGQNHYGIKMCGVLHFVGPHFYGLNKNIGVVYTEYVKRYYTRYMGQMEKKALSTPDSIKLGSN